MDWVKVFKTNPNRDSLGRFCTAEKAKGASVIHPRQMEKLHRDLGVGAWQVRAPQK